MFNCKFRVRLGRALFLAATIGAMFGAALGSGGAASAALPQAPATESSAALAALTGFDAAQRRNARIEIEPTSSAISASDLALASQAAPMWNAGEHDQALAILHAMSDPTTVAVGVSWLAPQGAPPDEGGIAGWSDVTISTVDAVGSIALDVYRPINVLYCVVQAADGWHLYRSNNGGLTWTNPYSWFGAAGVVDVDMTTVGSYVYIGYVVTGAAANELRVRRNFGNTGAADDLYGFEVALNAAPATIEEVAATSNVEDDNTNIYFAVLQSNDTVGYHWDTATDGTTWIEIDTGVINAERGLDATYNHTGGAQYFLFISYIASNDSVRVARRESGVGWDIFTVEATYTGVADRTCISAWGDTVVVAYRHLFDAQGVRYRISYEAGVSTWLFGSIYAPAAGEPPAVNFDVSAQGGFGTAAVYILQSGEPDEVWFRKRSGYAATNWDAPVQINDGDVFVSSAIEPDLNWATSVNGNSNNFRFGIVFPQPDPIFDRRQQCDGDVNESGAVDINDLLAVVGAWGACPDCDNCNADIDPFFGDCVVNINDLLEVVAFWGPCP